MAKKLAMDAAAERVCRTDGLPREEWLRLRKAGIGGSDAPSICGLNPWKSPLGVWMDKTGQGEPEKEPGEAAHWGNLLEEVVAKEFSRRTGYRIQKAPYLLRSRERPWMLANLDRLVWDERGELGILEIKTSGQWREKEWDGGAVPETYAIQTAHYLSVTGLSFAFVACLLGGQKLHMARIERDEALITALERIEANFWTNHVEALVPPEPGGTDADREAIGRLFPHGDGAEIELPDEAAELITRFEEAKTEEKVAAQKKQEAQNRLAMLLGDAAAGRVGDRRITAPLVTQSRIDTSALKKAHPAIAAEFTKETAFRRFDIR